MDRKKLFKHLACPAFLILAINFLANKFYRYSSIWYFDIIMHFLGGLWVGLAFLYFFPLHPTLPLVREGIKEGVRVLLFVLLIAVGWEVFEFFVNDVIAQNPFNFLDTISDILFGISGGLCAILYSWKKQLK